MAAQLIWFDVGHQKFLFLYMILVMIIFFFGNSFFQIPEKMNFFYSIMKKRWWPRFFFFFFWIIGYKRQPVYEQPTEFMCLNDDRNWQIKFKNWWWWWWARGKKISIPFIIISNMIWFSKFNLCTWIICDCHIFFWNHIFFSVIYNQGCIVWPVACLLVLSIVQWWQILIQLVCFVCNTKKTKICAWLLCDIIIICRRRCVMSSWTKRFFFVPFWWFDYELLFSTIMTMMMILFID